MSWIYTYADPWNRKGKPRQIHKNPVWLQQYFYSKSADLARNYIPFSFDTLFIFTEFIIFFQISLPHRKCFSRSKFCCFVENKYMQCIHVCVCWCRKLFWAYSIFKVTILPILQLKSFWVYLRPLCGFKPDFFSNTIKFWPFCLVYASFLSFMSIVHIIDMSHSKNMQYSVQSQLDFTYLFNTLKRDTLFTYITSVVKIL